MAQVNSTFRNVEQWLGIPYARAERFQKPQILPFDPNRPYDKFGPVSIQMAPLDYLRAESMSEDCLNLNVWAPIDRKEPLPVAVYIHGGGWTYGSNTQDTSNPSGLAASGKVIAVSLNYRLGALGWLSLSQYGGVFKDATNLGMQDLVVALKWIQENIAYFGGDPEQVTLFGHSGGAYNSLALMAVPETEGLFHRVAAFSGFVSRYMPEWWAEELAHKTIKTLGLHSPEELLTVDAKLLFKTTDGLLPTDSIRRHGADNICIGMVDDHELPNGVFCMNPIDFFKTGRRKDVDILVSSTTGEVDWYVLHDRENFDPHSIDAIIDEMVFNSRIPRSRAEKIVAYHETEGLEPVEVQGATYTDFNFTLPATRTVLSHAKAGGRAWQLNVGPVAGVPAVHGTEMYGIVGQTAPGATQKQVERDRLVTDIVLNLVTGNYGELWTPAGETPEVMDIGERPYVGSEHCGEVLKLFDGIERG